MNCWKGRALERASSRLNSILCLAGLPLHAGWLHPALACLRCLWAVSSLQKFQFGFMTVSLDTLGFVITLDEQPVVGHNVVHHDRRELHRVGAIPSAHDFCQDSVCVDWHRTGLDAASERDVGRHFRPIPGSVDDVEHLVASGQRGESRAGWCGLASSVSSVVSILHDRTRLHCRA